jgi:myosin heavy subunit
MSRSQSCARSLSLSSPSHLRAKPVGGDTTFKSKFIIAHYAGDVAYNINGFLDKNKDTVSPDLYQIGLTSTDPFIQELFEVKSFPPPLSLRS